MKDQSSILVMNSNVTFLQKRNALLAISFSASNIAIFKSKEFFSHMRLSIAKSAKKAIKQHKLAFGNTGKINIGL